MSGVTTVAAPVAARRALGQQSRRSDRGCGRRLRVVQSNSMAILCAAAGERYHHRQCGLPAIQCAPGAVFRQSESTRAARRQSAQRVSGCAPAEAAGSRTRAPDRHQFASAANGGAATQRSDRRPHRIIGRLVAGPSTRVAAVQRVLAEFGYGQIKSSGIFDEPTSAAIAKFEREHKLPVTGRLSERLLSELASMTGHPIE